MDSHPAYIFIGLLFKVFSFVFCTIFIIYYIINEKEEFFLYHSSQIIIILGINIF
jgi:hypothetical protein